MEYVVYYLGFATSCTNISSHL